MEVVSLKAWPEPKVRRQMAPARSRLRRRKGRCFLIFFMDGSFYKNKWDVPNGIAGGTLAVSRMQGLGGETFI